MKNYSPERLKNVPFDWNLTSIMRISISIPFLRKLSCKECSKDLNVWKDNKRSGSFSFGRIGNFGNKGSTIIILRHHFSSICQNWSIFGNFGYC